MPAYGNPLQSTSLRSQFATKAGPFMPRDTGANQYNGTVAPQGGLKPLNSDISKPSMPVKQLEAPQFQLTGAFSDIFNAQPGQVLPYVPPATAPLIQNMLGMHQGYANAALPLLDLLLGEMGNRTALSGQYFNPEMALRQGILEEIGRQDNSFLQQMLELQRRTPAPQSGTHFFAGF